MERIHVFNDPALLDVITKQKAFILTGLGHTGNNTLLDLIADFSAPTPSLAGTYLLNQYQLHHNSLSIQLTTHTISKEHDSLKTMLIISLVINALLFFFK